MQKKIKIVVSCVITICLTVCFLFYLTNLMERKSSVIKYTDFFEQEEDFDVLFLGTSHVINGVFPMELWDKYGIISYNFGGHSNELATTYWVMENALKYTNPQIVVIDCMQLSSSCKSSDIFSFLHLSLDAFPLSETKVKAVWDLLDDPVLDDAVEKGMTRQSDEPRTKMGLLWNYSVYHSRWAEIGQLDFEPDLTYEKGAESNIGLSRETLNKISSERKMTPGTTGEEYLRRMIEDCQKRKIEVLLTYLPFSASEEQQMEANYVYDIAEEYGVHYINFLDIELVNYQTDFCDAGHLNPSGARKVTNFLGEYLVSNYNIPDQRGNENYSYWYEDYHEYVVMKNLNVISCDNMEEYLMLLAGDDVEIAINIKNSDMIKNAWIMSLLDNLGINISELTDNTDFIIRNSKKATGTILDLQKDSDSIRTELGYFGLCPNEEMKDMIQNNISIQINVMRDGEKIDEVKFGYMDDSEIPNMVVVNR